jgi:hypothetical protein
MNDNALVKDKLLFRDLWLSRYEREVDINSTN